MTLEKLYNKRVFTAILIIAILFIIVSYIAIVVNLEISSFEIFIFSIFFFSVVLFTILFMMYAVYVKLKWFSNYFSKISFQKEKNEKKLTLSALYKPIFPLLDQLESKNRELEESVLELRRQSVVFEHNDLLLELNAELVVQKEELTTLAENLTFANQEILKQKQIAEDQNKTLTDNLAYASIIQAAVLTPTFNPRSFVK
ncbi:MAG: hypothetical protein IPO21_16345, partial [Bacteroidales bacterium]|nr:hypothetical protein [Bacteroidales bacterium]